MKNQVELGFNPWCAPWQLGTSGRWLSLLSKMERSHYAPSLPFCRTDGSRFSLQKFPPVMALHPVTLWGEEKRGGWGEGSLVDSVKLPGSRARHNTGLEKGNQGNWTEQRLPPIPFGSLHWALRGEKRNRERAILTASIASMVTQDGH